MTLPIGSHRSTYTNGELLALIAPVLGVSAEDIKGIAFVVNLGDRFSLGGTPDPEAAKFILFSAIMSGLLEA